MALRDQPQPQVCPLCNGTGKVAGMRCRLCNGTGQVGP